MINFLLTSGEWQHIWTIVAWGLFLILTIVVEAATVDLVSIWFTLGAIVGLILAIFNVPLWVQILVFAVVSIISLIVGRILLKKFVKKSKSEPSNFDRYIGQVIILKTGVDKFNHGSALIGDVTWTVSVNEDIRFEAGDRCIVDAIEGNKIIVSRKEK